MKLFSKALTLLVAFILTVGVIFALASCGPDTPDGPVTYSATVVDDAGVGIEGAVLKFKVGSAVYEKRTNVAGAASITVEEEKLSEKITVEVKELPAGYSVSGGAVEFGDKTSVSFTATKTYKYTVSVLADGEGVEGARIQLLVGGESVEAMFTDMNGIAEFYLAATDKAVCARLTVPLGYVADGGTTVEFDADKTATFNLLEQVQYTVTTRDLQGFAVSGVEISVYRRSDDELMLTRNITSSGAVSFYLDKDNYYVTVSVVNPAVVLTADADEDGVKRIPLLETDTSKILYFSHTQDAIEYRVNVKDSLGAAATGVTVRLLNTSHELVATAVSDAEGVAKFNVPNGSYVAIALGDTTRHAEPLSFTKNATVVGDIEFVDGYAGADENAAQLFDNNLNEIHLPTGAGAWFYIVSSINRSLRIENAEGVRVIYDGEEYTPVGGVITVALSGSGESQLEVINSGDSAVSLTASVEKLGGVDNPITLTPDSDIEIVLINGEVVYYTFTAVGDKTLTVTLSGEYSDLATVFINGMERESLAIKNGQTVTLAFTATEWEDTTVNYTVNVTFEAQSVDYTVNVQIENVADPSGIILQLYRDGVATGIFATTDSDGVAVFENIHEYPDYTVVVENIPSGYETLIEKMGFEDNKSGISITLIPDGSRTSPFDIIIGEQQYFEGVYNAWFEINIRGVSEHIVKFVASFASVEIFDAQGTSLGEFITDAYGSCYYVFNGTDEGSLGEGVYFLHFTTPYTGVTVSSQTAGYDPDLPQKIDESGEHSVSVKTDGGTVYCEYVGELDSGDTVTVTVEDGASLLINGEVDTDGSYIFTYDGSDILFAITAELAENYDVKITVE